MADEEQYEVDGQLPLMEDPFEAAEVQRLADALEVMDAGGHPDINPREDPELAAFMRAAGMLHQSMDGMTESDAFDSYRARSRAYILHSLEADAIARPQQPRDPRISVFGPRPQRSEPSRTRWAAFSAVAAAAAAASMFFFVGGQGDGADTGAVQISPALATNFTQPGGELDRIQDAIFKIKDNTSKGQPADTNSLRTVTETTAAVAKVIENKPDSVTKEAVTTYLATVNDAREVLESVAAADDNQGALAAAQVATEGGQITATRFLEAATSTPTATPSPTPTASPSPTATASPTPTATPSPTPAPSVTPTATATPAPTAEPTASATPEPERP